MIAVSESQLVFKVEKTVVDRSRREHKDFGVHAGKNDPVEKLQVTVFMLIFSRQFAAVAEVVGFINHHKVVIAPIEPVQIKTVGRSAGA